MRPSTSTEIQEPPAHLFGGPSQQALYRRASDEFLAQLHRATSHKYVEVYWSQSDKAALIGQDLVAMELWRAAFEATHDKVKLYSHVTLAVYLEYRWRLGAEAFWQAFGKEELRPMYKLLQELREEKKLQDYLKSRLSELTNGEI